MSFSSNDAGNVKAGRNPQPTQQPQQQPTQQPSQVVDVRNQRAIFGRAITRNTLGEVLRNLVGALEAPALSGGLRLTPVEGHEVGIDVPVLAVGAGDKVVLVFIDTGRYAPAVTDINGRRTETPTVVTDMASDRNINKLMSYISQRVGGDIQVVGTMPWYNGMDVTLAHTLLFYANEAILNATEKDGVKWSLELLSGRDALEVSVDYTGGHSVMPCTNAPCRSDVTITTGVVVSEQGGQYRDPLGVLSGALEFHYAPSSVVNSFGMVVSNNVTTPEFKASFTITNWDTTFQRVTPELMLLSLSSVAVLTHNLNWVNHFRLKQRSTSGDRFNPRDVGALLAVSEKRKFDTQSSNLQDIDWMRYLGSMTESDLAIGAHLQEGGPLSWFTDTIYGACMNNRADVEAVLDAADELTSGCFAARWNQTRRQVGMVVNDRVILGTYTDENGVEHDLREVDTLFMLNMRPQDPEWALTYQDTFDCVDVPIDVRVEKRLQILQSIFGSNMKVTGYARYVIFDPEFLGALAAALLDSGVMTQMVGSSNSSIPRQRGASNLAGYGASRLGEGLYKTQGGNAFNDQRSTYRGHGSFRRF